MVQSENEMPLLIPHETEPAEAEAPFVPEELTLPAREEPEEETEEPGQPPEDHTGEE